MKFGRFSGISSLQQQINRKTIPNKRALSFQ